MSHQSTWLYHSLEVDRKAQSELRLSQGPGLDAQGNGDGDDDDAWEHTSEILQGEPSDKKSIHGVTHARHVVRYVDVG